MFFACCEVEPSPDSAKIPSSSEYYGRPGTLHQEAIPTRSISDPGSGGERLISPLGVEVQRQDVDMTAWPFASTSTGVKSDNADSAAGPGTSMELTGDANLMPYTKKLGRQKSKLIFQAAGSACRTPVNAMESYLNAGGSRKCMPAEGGAVSSTKPAASTKVVPVTKEIAAVNMAVVRGPNWKWGEEDGGAGQVGTILSVDLNQGTATVGWRITSQVGAQYCLDGDLSVAEEALEPASPDSPMRASRPRNRRDSQFMFSSKQQTVIVFDWDDTLFPTTYVREDMGLAWQKPMQEQQRVPEEIEAITQKLRMCEDNVLKLLPLACRLGKVILVTLARSGWVTQSCDNFYPRCGALIDELKVPVVYAQTGVQVDYNRMAMMSNEDLERYWSGVKGSAIANEVNDFYSQYEGQSWKNIISIGDSHFERKGTQAATSDYMRRRGMSTQSIDGQLELEEVNGHVLKVRTKTFKLVDQPTIDELTVEIAMLQKWLPLMVNLDKGFDVNFASVYDSQILEDIEKTLKGSRIQKSASKFQTI